MARIGKRGLLLLLLLPVAGGALFLTDSQKPLDDVFAEFEQRRRKRVESISAVARSNDERSLKQLGTFGCWMRDRLFPVLAPLIARGLEKQYSAAVV